jgi:hypothetical protein
LECSRNARLLFIGLWNFCDDEGRHPLKTKQIKAEIFPADELTESDILGMLQELSKNGLVTAYKVDSEQFLQVDGWHHQRIDKPQPAKYPAPPQDDSGNVLGTFLPDRIGEDRKGEEGRGREMSGVHVPDQRLLKSKRKTLVVNSSSVASRLSPDWKLPVEFEDWAATNFPAWGRRRIVEVGEGFRDYWIGVPGQKGSKCDWFATWRNWCRRERTEAKYSKSDAAAADFLKGAI